LGAKAISSDMFFDRAEKQPGDIVENTENYLLGRTSLGSNTSYDEYRETAKQYMENASERAKEMKDKAMDWLNGFAAGSSS